MSLTARRRWVIGVVGIGMAVAATPAEGAVICVGRSDADCQAPIETNLQTALNRAQAQAGADEVRLRAGTYVSSSVAGFTYASASNPVTIRGAGQGVTTIRNGVPRPSAVLTVDGPAGMTPVAARDLSVVAAEPANGGAALVATDGDVQDVSISVVGSDSVEMEALALTRGAARRVTARAEGPFAIGVLARQASVADSDLDATVGVSAGPLGAPEPVSVARTRIRSSRTGIEVCNTAATVDSTSLELTGGVGIEVSGGQRCGAANSTFTGRNLTIVGAAGERGGTGIQAGASNTNPTATLRDSILWGLNTTVQAQVLAGQTSTLTLARLAEEPGRRALGGGGTLTLDDQGGNVGDPRLRNLAARDLRPAAGSPVIDAGTPGALAGDESATDLAGGARLLDGDGDGQARRDIGAFESPPLPLPPPPVAPPAAPVVPARPAPAVDRTAPRLSGLRFVRRPTARIILTSTEAARAVVTLRGCRRLARGCREVALGRQRVAIRRGLTRVTLSRALRRGLGRATRVLVQATDAGGNRSRAVSRRLGS